MKIALLAHSVLPRGGVVHTLALADALLDLGHEVSVCLPVEPGQALFCRPRARVLQLPVPAPPPGPLVEQVRHRIASIGTGLDAVLSREHFDLLHAQDSLNGNALADIADLADRGMPLPPWVRTVHHLDDFDAPALRAWQERAWQRASAVGCVSDLWCAHFGDVLGVPVERLRNGVDRARFQPTGPRPARGPYVLALGGVERRKNTTRLLEAFAEARRRDPSWYDTTLVVAGGASLLDHSAALGAWRDALARLGLAEGEGEPVLRLGTLPHDDVPAWMRGARLLAMPSLVEGFGLVALEALACGTPVLVSDRPPFTEHLAGCPRVAWCDPENVSSIADGLIAAGRMPTTDAVPAVCRDHDWSRSARGHVAWYRRVLSGAADPVAPAGHATCH